MKNGLFPGCAAVPQERSRQIKLFLCHPFREINSGTARRLSTVYYKIFFR